MRNFIAIPFVLTIIFGPTEVWSEPCNIRDFLIRDIKSIKQSAEVELSFVLSASEQDFNRVKEDKGSDQLELTSLEYKTAQEKARRIAQSIHFDYKTSYPSDYFAQTISPDAIKNYSECVTGKYHDIGGLYIWLDSRKGDFFNFTGFWVGGELKGGSDLKSTIGVYIEAPTISGATFVDKPESWPSGETKEIIVKRTANTDFLFKLNIGDPKASSSNQKAIIEIVKDPPGIAWDEKPVASNKEMQAATHGPNPGCSSGSDDSCVFPQHLGGTLLVDTANIEHTTSDPTTYSQRITSASPQRICASITQSTGCCECPQSAKGLLSAIERFPLPAQ